MWERNKRQIDKLTIRQMNKQTEGRPERNIKEEEKSVIYSSNSIGVKYSLIFLGGGYLHHVSVLTTLLVKSLYSFLLKH